MAHPLERKVDALRKRVRRLVAVHGLSWLIVAGLAVALLLGLADYLFRFQDRGMRVILSLVVVGALGWSGYRCLLARLAARLPDVELAKRLQRAFPALGDSLASSLEFIRQPEDDVTAGSGALRRAVIAQTTAAAERFDFREAARSAATLRAAFAAMAVGLAAMAALVASPAASRIALARLVNPFNDVAWPQSTHLAIVNRVQRIATGQSFEVEVVDARGRALPADVRIYYRFTGPHGAAMEEAQTMRLVDGRALAERENVTRSFSFRVEGGDDLSMPWLPVEVVEPPRIKSFTVELAPPAYTGRPETASEKSIRSLVGTRARITGTATRALSSATLCLEGGQPIEARIAGSDGRQVQFEFAVERSGAYWFELTDREGLSGGEGARWQILAIPDEPPTVAIEQPLGNLFVTPEAVVPIRVAVKDDLGIRRIDLVSGRSDRPDEPEAVELLYQRADSLAPQPGAAGDSGESRVATYAWPLAGLGLSPGVQIVFRATATDDQPRTGESDPRRLSVITAEELTDRIASRQAFILSELSRVLEVQRQGRQDVATLETQARQAQPLSQVDLDHLRGAELNQRQVERTLTSRSDGVPVHVLGLLADLQNNKIDTPGLAQRMQAMLEEIDRLGREHLPAIGRELTAAIKTAQIRLDEAARPDRGRAGQGGAGEIQAIADPLATVGQHQDAVIASLEGLLGQLARWESLQQFHRDIGQLLRDQGELRDRTTELGRRTLTKELKDVSPQEQADLKTAGQQQQELARRLETVQQEIEQASAQSRQADPTAAENLADALSRARQLDLSGRMRSAGESVAQNRIGQAIGAQQEIVAGLQELFDILANRRRQAEAKQALEQMARLRDSLQAIHQRQQKTLDQTRRLDGLARSQGQLTGVQAESLRDLARQQQTLDAETTGLSAKLPGAEVFRLALSGAGQEMGRAARLLDAGQTNEPVQSAETSALARLAQIIEALKPELAQDDQGQGGAGQGGQGGQGQGSAADSIRALAELKLLRLMQIEINNRTQAIESAYGSLKELSAEARREYAQLSQSQGQLASLLLGLIGPEEDPEGTPEGLPGLGPDTQEDPLLRTLEEGSR